MTTVSLATLNSADKKSFIAALGDVYEQAPWVAEAVHGQRPFASLNARRPRSSGSHCSRATPTSPARPCAPER